MDAPWAIRPSRVGRWRRLVIYKSNRLSFKAWRNFSRLCSNRTWSRGPGPMRWKMTPSILCSSLRRWLASCARLMMPGISSGAYLSRCVWQSPRGNFDVWPESLIIDCYTLSPSGQSTRVVSELECVWEEKLSSPQSFGDSELPGTICAQPIVFSTHYSKQYANLESLTVHISNVSIIVDPIGRQY